MTEKEMLEKLGLSKAELKNLLLRFKFFLDYLDEPQQKVVRASLPTLDEALKAFGPDATEKQLCKLFEGEKGEVPTILVPPCKRLKSCC